MEKEAGVSEARLSGLLPVAVFLVLFIGSGVVLQNFYAMPAVVAFLCALAVAFAQNPRRTFDEKLDSVARSMGEPNVMIMCLVFVLAGAFTGAVSAAGGVDSTVNFALSVLPTGIVLPGLFLIACFISLSMGTSVGTIAALAPIAIGIALKTDLGGALCLGAIVGGAMFGDNLSMISDTTIAATRTQGCRMDDKFKENFKIALPAAIITFVVLLVIGLGSDYAVQGDLTYNLWQVLPYIAVLVAALAGVNVFVVLVAGTVLSAIVGLALGTISPENVFTVVGSGPDGSGGIMNMYDITVISIICAGIIGLVKDNGGIDWVLDLIRGRVHSPKGAQFGIAALTSAVDISTANNTVAIVIAGPIVKDISEEYDISPRRAASLIDTFASVWQGIIPYGAQLLYASAGAAAAGMAVSPFEIVPFLFYPFLLAASALAYIAIRQK
ncbi:Na+/H+ antiporter NhaC family protein [Curtanaerobium respiraculi]|uniref:Na+/H+ antiporter NhaC family protein n=1 Tax=Curtanaerobium respiraculi TaxID=2949669 RepID=UPI0024B3A16F|nr:Na+/H+ antiporter NhaC family protein [Curtanaerobium respiraculi]